MEKYWKIRNQLAVLRKGESVLVFGNENLKVTFDKDGYFKFRNRKLKSLSETTELLYKASNGIIESFTYVAQYYNTLDDAKDPHKLKMHTFEVDAEIGAKDLMKKVTEVLPEEFILVSLTLAYTRQGG